MIALDRSKISFVALCASAVSALTIPSIAQAQDAASTPAEPATQAGAPIAETIVVTGTRIKGIAPTGSPVIGLGRADIEATGASTTTEILSQLPQVFNLGASEANYGAANNQSANVTLGTGINLRGLGTESTLTLLDGRRLPSSGTQAQFFDPSVIPSMAVERIEVLADGGSGIYGSDAVGGVVNIMLRKLDGAEFEGRYGFAGDMDEYKFGGAIGKNWGSGSLTVSGEYIKRSNLKAADRSFYTDDLRPYGGTDQRSTFSNPGNILVNGTSYAIPTGQNGTGLTPGDFQAGTVNRESRYLGTDALPEQERYSFAAVAEQDVNSWLSLNAQGFIAHRRGTFANAAPTATLNVTSANPFFVDPSNSGADSVQVQYSFLDDLGNSVRRSTQDVIFITGGPHAELGGGWSADAFFSYGEDRERSGALQVNNSALAAALADTNPDTAFNPFGDGSNTNPGTLQTLIGEFRVDTNYRMQEYGVAADGPLFTIPGGDVKVALGASRQEITFINLTPLPANGHRAINSMSGELFVPIVGADNAGPFMEELNVSAAVRYDDYSDIGSTTNPKLGVTWKPTSSLSIRGSYGKSFRAPTLSDTGSPFNTLADFTDVGGGTTRVLFLRGGKAGLQPEKATTWSVGMDYKPVFANGLSLSATYYNVDYTNRLATPGNDYLALTKEDILGSLITRNPTAAEVNAIQDAPGFVGVPEDPANIGAIVDGRKSNVGIVQTDGIEVIADYTWDSDWATFKVGANGAYILHFKQAITPDAPLIDIVNTINNPLQFQARAYAGIRKGGFSGTAYVNYTDGYDNNSVTPMQKVDSYTTVDLSLRYLVDGDSIFTRGLTFTLDVTDAFDANPPYVSNGTIAFDSNVVNPTGRKIAIGVRKSF
ncbi:TonB-dependent receptor [Altererythrobacter indicus]|uniref:TonB-dependent receptor n=1 Tax=Altericroceibacterium indicum TaxID=374177 RepID=A0A845ACJ0_9SPHN|nr:TonB-dependent receptor [Altericroceibacterium indicum]MXP26711.1 TonB-dependent receptor [Altericroceibacterium indicum]